MKKIYYLPMLLLLSISLLLSCSDNPTGAGGNDMDNGSSGSIPTGNFNKADTTISLQKGRFTLAIPAGAMETGIHPSIDSSHKAFIDTSDVIRQFQLLPTGTTFKKPVTLTFHYDSTWLKGHSPWDIGIAYQNDSDGKWYAAINGTVDTLKHTISIKTTHFSHWTMFNCFHLYMQYEDQLSEDNSQTINMKTGATAYLLVDMAEPPAWKNDPDKDGNFSHPLVAPLVPQKITPKEDYQKALKPDAWYVEGNRYGNGTYGTISPAGGVSDKLYTYHAPKKAPNPPDVGISAQIDYKNTPRILLLLQNVHFKSGEWELAVTDSVDVTAAQTKVATRNSFSTQFHIDKYNKIIYDGESHTAWEFYKFSTPGLNSWKISTPGYEKVINVTGTYNKTTNILDSQLNLKYVGTPSTFTFCFDDETPPCVTATRDFSQYTHVLPDAPRLKLKAEDGYTTKWDSTITNSGGKIHLNLTYTLKEINKKD